MSYYKMVRLGAYRIFPRSFSHTRLGLRPRPVLKTTSSRTLTITYICMRTAHYYSDVLYVYVYKVRSWMMYMYVDGCWLKWPRGSCVCQDLIFPSIYVPHIVNTSPHILLLYDTIHTAHTYVTFYHTTFL